MTPSRLTYLLNQVSISEATKSEYDELLVAIREDDSAETAREITAFLKEQPSLRAENKEYSPEMLQAVFSKIMGAVKVDEKMVSMPVRRPVINIWLKYTAAAAVVLGIIFGSYFLFIRKPQQQPAAQIQKANDILPGGNKAVLTLSNGSKIILDSVHNGVLAQQGSTDIIKTDSGKLTYNTSTDKPTGQTALNTLSTPRGGQYQLILPDGTKVWLDAASSITYPTAFVGKERKVKITGEAYFEVAHNAKRPFRVEVADQFIEDIGTSFNVNAYADEPDIKTTLLEGSVKIIEATQSQLLKPGDQGITSLQMKNRILVTRDIDLNKIMAWKNGWFEFDQSGLDGIMRQVSRWYDVDVVYKGSPTNQKFWGRISKDLPLSNILQSLEANGRGLKFKVEGTKVIVYQ